MSTDLDVLDEIFPEHVTKTARAGGKFQPKAKPRPRKESSIKLPSSQSLQNISIADHETKKLSENNLDSLSRVHPFNNSALVDSSLEQCIAGEALVNNLDLHTGVVIPDVNGKPTGENADIFFGLEDFDDFHSQVTTATAGISSGSPDKTHSSVQQGNESTRLCPVNNDSKDFGPSEIPIVNVTADDSSLQTCTAVPNTLETLSCDEQIVSDSDRGFQLNNRVLEIEEAETVPCSEGLDSIFGLPPESGQRSRKFQPKPKFQVDKRKAGASTSHLDQSVAVPCFQYVPSVPSESDYRSNDSIPALVPNEVHDFPSSRCDDTASELLWNEERTGPAETSLLDALNSGDNPVDVSEISEKVCQSAELRERKMPTVSDDSLGQQASISGQGDETGKSTRKLRKRINKYALVDEDEVHDAGNFTNECPSGSPIDDDDHDDGEYQLDKEIQIERTPKKANKSSSQKAKPVRKRKKVPEAPDQEAKQRKKFSHSTRRMKRRVNKVLLETPEDEIDVRKLCFRDIILLAEHRERMSNKEGKTADTPSAYQSAGKSFANYSEDEAFASERGHFSEDQTETPIQASSINTNYHSFMKKTPRSRWSKQETELFYEAVQQFGSDLSMIQQLFPGRTRAQIKLKYKKEERQQPLRLHEALTNRTGDHSHFQWVIEQLQRLAAQGKQNSIKDDSNVLTGNEEELNPDINEEVEKPEKREEREVEVDTLEPDVSEVHSPVKSSYDSEDDFCTWSNYKSEL